MNREQDLVELASAQLRASWEDIADLAKEGEPTDSITDTNMLESIGKSVNSSSISYRYVLPTQLLAKVVESSLDAKCLQVARGGAGAFDARSLAHKVIVPFDQANHRVLGGSPEPYVNNPLRVPEVSESYRSPQRNKTDWDHLCRVLGTVEERQDTAFTLLVFKQVLIELYRRLTSVNVVYPVPNRISLERCLLLLQEFLSDASGGDRLLALTSALFQVLGARFHLFARVRRATITTADQSAGMVADLECLADDGSIVMAVEVKDKVLTVSQVNDKIPDLRTSGISEIFFVAQQGVASADEEAVREVKQREFIAGHNLYIVDLTSLAGSTLALIGEAGRRDYLIQVGQHLNAYRSDIRHRKAWADLLQQG